MNTCPEVARAQEGIRKGNTTVSQTLYKHTFVIKDVLGFVTHIEPVLLFGLDPNRFVAPDRNTFAAISLIFDLFLSGENVCRVLLS